MTTFHHQSQGAKLANTLALCMEGPCGALECGFQPAVCSTGITISTFRPTKHYLGTSLWKEPHQNSFSQGPSLKKEPSRLVFVTEMFLPFVDEYLCRSFLSSFKALFFYSAKPSNLINNTNLIKTLLMPPSIQNIFPLYILSSCRWHSIYEAQNKRTVTLFTDFACHDFSLQHCSILWRILTMNSKTSNKSLLGCVV